MTEPIELTLGYLRRHPASAATVLETLATEDAAAYLRAVSPLLAAPVVSAMLPSHAARCLEAAGEDFALGVLPAMAPTAAAAALRRINRTTTASLLAKLPVTLRFRLRLLLRYPITTVGAWMVPDVTVLPTGASIEEAWALLRREAETLERFLYVVDRDQHLLGYVASTELLHASNNMIVDRLMKPVAAPLKARADITSVLGQDLWRDSDPLPVVAADGRFLGVARYAELRHAGAIPDSPRSGSVAGYGLMALLDAYWSALSHLIEVPLVSRSSPRRPPSGKE